MGSLFRTVPLLALVLSALPHSAVANPLSIQAKAAQPPYINEAFVVQSAVVNYSYNADGTGLQDVNESIKIQNEAGVTDFSVITATYAGATQSAKVISVRVLHPDGSVTMTPASDAIDQPALATQQAPLYSDIKVLQIPIRGLRPGDTLSFHLQIIYNKPEVPAEFWNAFQFLKKSVVLHQTVTLEYPESKFVQVWDPGYKPVVTESAGNKIYTWSYQQLKPTSDNESGQADATSATKPDIGWTTFRNWQQVGDWYRTLAAPNAAPTPAIIAEANALTQGITDPEQQVKAIYNFVSTHIRYVGVDFGVGKFEPHPAAVVLANQYGDCKDKDTLLEALLHAKGFTTAPVLIGSGISLIPDLPSPGLFDHVITTVMLPSGQIWLDSTPEVAPFRMLVSQLRGKQALVIPAKGPAELERTPAQPPFPFIDRLVAIGKITAQGDLTAHVVITDRSDSELLLRTLARNIAPVQWNQGAQYLIRLLGFGGTVTNAAFTNVENLDQPIRLSYDYTRTSFGDWANYRILPLFPVISLPAVPDKQPSGPIKLGAQRTEIAVTRLTLPAGFSANLPDAVHVKTPFATFDKIYSLENGVLTIRRTVVILHAKLPAASWKEYKKFAADTSLNEYTYIQLTTPSTISGSASHPSVAGENDPDAAKLVTAAVHFEQVADWKSALNRLDRAKAIQPKQPYLWSGYGYVAMNQGHSREALKDFHYELELHPDENYVVALYAGYLQHLKKYKDAEAILSAAFLRDPSSYRIALMLANLQADHNLTGAIATLHKAIAASPSNFTLNTVLAIFLIRNHQQSEAADILKKQLHADTTAGALNNDSYILAKTGLDLPMAEEYSRKSLSMLDSQTGSSTIGEATEQSFVQSVLLVNSWDTLGYILMRESKLAEARVYLAAAWNNLPDTTTGAHYGALLEKLHQPAAALRIDRIAFTLQDAPKTPEYPELKTAISRLKKAGYRSSVRDGDIDLESARTFHLHLQRPLHAYSEATFRLQFSSARLINVLRVSGDASLNVLVSAITELRLPRYVPASSHAHLLRDAIATCAPGAKECDFVMMPMGSIRAEGPEN